MVSDTLSTRRQPARLAADEIDKKKARQERQTALIFALLIGAFAASGIALLANSGQHGPATVNDCVSVESTPARLACFDDLARRSAPMPFKGVPPT
jgi:hypothetical protein